MKRKNVKSGMAVILIMAIVMLSAPVWAAEPQNVKAALKNGYIRKYDKYVDIIEYNETTFVPIEFSTLKPDDIKEVEPVYTLDPNGVLSDEEYTYLYNLSMYDAMLYSIMENTYFDEDDFELGAKKIQSALKGIKSLKAPVSLLKVNKHVVLFADTFYDLCDEYLNMYEEYAAGELGDITDIDSERIENTYGLIQVHLEGANLEIEAFFRAKGLDPYCIFNSETYIGDYYLY